MSALGLRRPRKPPGRWVYYLLQEGIVWPCPVHWEWEASYFGWLPFYFAPSFEYIAADPTKVTKVARLGGKSGKSVTDNQRSDT